MSKKKCCKFFPVKYTQDAQVPVVHNKDKDKHVDKKVELKCEATFSSPLVEDNVDLYTIEWFKEGKPVKEVASLKNRYVLGTHNITLNDVGKLIIVYVCCKGFSVRSIKEKDQTLVGSE